MITSLVILLGILIMLLAAILGERDRPAEIEPRSSLTLRASTYTSPFSSTKNTRWPETLAMNNNLYGWQEVHTREGIHLVTVRNADIAAGEVLVDGERLKSPRPHRGAMFGYVLYNRHTEGDVLISEPFHPEGGRIYQYRPGVSLQVLLRGKLGFGLAIDHMHSTWAISYLDDRGQIQKQCYTTLPDPLPENFLIQAEDPE
jgi:hypothetical protein